MSSLATASIPLLGPLLTQRWNWRPEDIGYITAASSLGICWYLAAGSPMMARYGPLRSLQIGLGFIAVGLGLMSSASSAVAFFGALILGLGVGPNTPAGSQILLRTAPKSRRNLIFSVKQAGMPFGGALAGLAIVPLAVQVGDAKTIIIICLICVVSAIIVQPIRAKLDEARDRQRNWLHIFLSPSRIQNSLRVLRAHDSLRTLAILGIALSVMQACVLTFISTFLVHKNAKSLSEAGYIVATLLLSSFTARLFFGWLADRFQNGLRLLAIIALTASTSVLTLANAGAANKVALYGLVIVVGASALGWTGVLMAELAKFSPPDLVGEVTSASSLFGFVGYVVGPIMFALIVKTVGSFELAFTLTAVQLATVTAIAWKGLSWRP